MAACENSTSVLCCCHIVPFVVEERNFLSRRITRLTLCWWGYTGGSRYVAQNKCVFLPGKMFVSWQKVLTGDPLLTLKKPKCLPSVRLKLKADLDMVFWGIVRPVITGTRSDKQRRWRLQRHETIRQCRHQSYWHGCDQNRTDVSLTL